MSHLNLSTLSLLYRLARYACVRRACVAPVSRRFSHRRDLKGSNGRYFRDFLTVDGTTSDVEIRECGIGRGRRAPYI